METEREKNYGTYNQSHAIHIWANNEYSPEKDWNPVHKTFYKSHLI